MRSLATSGTNGSLRTSRTTPNSSVLRSHSTIRIGQTSHCTRIARAGADGDPRYAELEARFNPVPEQRVPTLTLHGALDPVNSPQMSEGKEAYFIGPYERRLIAGAGHFPQRERAADVASRIVDWLGRYR